MSDTSLLEGKVRKWTLPIIQPPSGPDAPALKRLALPQGELAQLYDAEPGMRYLALIELRAGCTRGNHYHEVKEEWIYLIQGEVLLVAQDLKTAERVSLTLKQGDLAQIQPRVAHALRIIEAGQAVEFSTARFDAADIYKFPL